MISTIAELLEAFKIAEKEVLDNYEMSHPVTIGTMYEGLTGEILNRSLFQGLNLRVVKNSFIKGSDVEFDILLVEGEGESIPHTDRFKYEANQVIVVIQVKKNLYSSDVKDSYENLQYIINHYDINTQPYVRRLVNDSFRAICRKDIEAMKLGLVTEEEEAIFDVLKVEASLPVRIIWGYNGFANEYNFRESLMTYLSKNITTDPKNIIGGFGPHNFPNLIICGKYSIVKFNGMPYGRSLDENNQWILLGSSPHNPMNFFLELIWTRLTYKFDMTSDIFGDDLEMEPFLPLLSCKIGKLGDQFGWNFNQHVFAKEDILEEVPLSEWEPTELNMTQYVIFQEIIRNGDVVIDQSLDDFVNENKEFASSEEFIKSLISTGLVWRSENRLKPLTDEAQCVILPDGRVMAGENKSGRLTNWALKQMQNKKNQTSE
ncbi:DUF6602 domain-containing protein [Fluviicola taffensis]|uniref:DUF6602 domain-containing protein n=1 Tax=Fluviicola taffensis TaxID=191579 RepID=UPI0031377509